MIGLYLFGFALYFLILLGFSWLIGRLLGVRQSWLRGMIAAAIGMGAGGSFAVAVARQSGLKDPDPVILYVVALLVMMSVSVGLELLSRQGPPVVRPVHLPNPIRALQTNTARAKRYVQVLRILARHRLLPNPRRNVMENPSALGANLRGALAEAGGVFVKLGQVLSTRPDLLPQEVIEELSKLQDAVPPAPYEEIRALFVESLGAPPEDLFSGFQRAPLAAASIAQVYQASLPGGEQVVVKVQRPGIRSHVEQDLDILLMMARAAEARTDWGRRFQLVDLAARFAEVMREELDFRVEAGNLQAVCASLEPGSPIRIPVVYPHLSNDKVLVIEWIDGVNVREANRQGSLPPGSRNDLARSLFRSLARQIFFGSAFHADPHPGNVLVLPSSQLVLIDFGLVGRLNTLQQTAMREMLVALERRDPAALRDALLEIAELPSGGLPAERDVEQLERALAQLLARRLGVGMATNAALFSDLFHILLDFGLAMPGEIGGVFRAMVTLEGTLRLLAPDFQIMEETRALAADWLRDSLTPASMQQSLQEELTSLMPVLQRLPRRMERIAASIEHGTLTTNVRLFSHPDEAHFVSRLVSRVVMAFLSAAVGLMAVMLLRTPGGGQLSDTLTVFQAFGYVGLVISAALMLRVLAGIARE